ncbi:Pentatricopeptide repeat-containing protein [Apostasia shenzhenica]|uniref:Pentatricopeptide repeat-containing protein n=1 Tax=Apostasia shenzhenica TaxID=1088818 RepID=A0A2I0A210_9ASPA|nr:Pentatricopeptide repeat-containing protein [Apostasia shenzhenica]
MLASSSSSPPVVCELKTLPFLIRSPESSAHLRRILARVFRLGAHQNNFIATILIGRFRRPEHSLRLLRVLPRPNILPFNASIRVLSDSSPSTALSLFVYLKQLSLSPNDFTFSDLLRACALSRNDFHALQIHAHVIKSRYGSDPFVSTALLSAYCKCVSNLVYARRLFDEMPVRRMVCSWTCLIAAYAQCGLSEESLSLFVQMINENLLPWNDTMVSVLSACSSLEGKKIDDWVGIFEDCNNNDSAVIVLIYLYAKLGRVEESRDLFNKMRVRGREGICVVAWNAMITGHVQNGEPIEALDLFHCLLSDASPKPNHVTIVSVLSACAMVGDLNLGRWAHEFLKSHRGFGVLESNKILATAVIDMYSKCGSLKEAKLVFDRMEVKDVVSFNTMIMGMAMNGEEMQAVDLFSEMEKFKLKPDGGTFLGLLSACAHSGMVDKGRLFFKDMREKYSICCKLEHFGCFIDLLARAGFLEEAFEVVQMMPVEPNGLVWGSLLGGCLLHSKVDLAREVSKRLLNADCVNSGGYVMLSNAFAVDHNWHDIEKLRELMEVRGVKKQPGCSWITINGIMHEFGAGCYWEYESEKIICALNSLCWEMRSLCIDY